MAEHAIKADRNCAAMVAEIRGGAERLRQIVNNMLDITRLNYGELPLNYEPVSLAVLMQELEAELASTLKARKLKLTLQSLNGLPILLGDRYTLSRAFEHLMVNAIKYTPEGGLITVTGRAFQDHQNGRVHDSIEIIVSDTGIGIDPQDQELIFEIFYRIDPVSSNAESEGELNGDLPGLGLAAVRSIVEAHGGRVWAASPGRDEQTLPGSEFHIILPLAR